MSFSLRWGKLTALPKSLGPLRGGIKKGKGGERGKEKEERRGRVGENTLSRNKFLVTVLGSSASG